MTVQGFNERSATDKLLLRALIISLLIHLAVFGTWKWGQTHNLWRHVNFPAWMRLTPKLLIPAIPKNAILHPKSLVPSQLVFVDVDPALAQAAPPKNPKFYSANNSIAANPTPKNLPVPELKGRQDKVVKTTENVKLTPQPLQPSPKITRESDKTAQTKALPQKAYTPGNLVMAKPKEKTQDKNGQALAESTDKTDPQVQDQDRTIAAAKTKKGMLGDKSRQEGGVNHLRLEPGLDAIKTPFGDYDAKFIDAVRTRWYQLLENRSTEGSGRVMVEFHMHPDGRITDLTMTRNEMSDLLGLICQRAILDPAPYGPWPEEMRREIPNNVRDVTFIFYYSTE